MNTTEKIAGNGVSKDSQTREIGSKVSFETLSESERTFIMRVRSVFTNQNPKRIVKELCRLGFEVLTGGRNGHYRLRHELTGSRVFPFGSSPSDRRFGLNFVREVRWAILARRCA